jgi:DNA-binding GntR family transcriptional regulator
MAPTRSELREERRLIAASHDIDELEQLRERLRRRIARGLRRKGHPDARRLADFACWGMHHELPAEFRHIGGKAYQTALAILRLYSEVIVEWGFSHIRLERDGDYSPIQLSAPDGRFLPFLTPHEERSPASPFRDQPDLRFHLEATSTSIREGMHRVSAPNALWPDVGEDLIRQIKARNLPANHVLTYEDISARYRVSRGVAARAVRELVGSGWLIKVGRTHRVPGLLDPEPAFGALREAIRSRRRLPGTPLTQEAVALHRDPNRSERTVLQRAGATLRSLAQYGLAARRPSEEYKVAEGASGRIQAQDELLYQVIRDIAAGLSPHAAMRRHGLAHERDLMYVHDRLVAQCLDPTDPENVRRTSMVARLMVRDAERLSWVPIEHHDLQIISVILQGLDPTEPA